MFRRRNPFEIRSQFHHIKGIIFMLGAVVIPSKSGLSFIKKAEEQGIRVEVVIPSKSGLSFISLSTRPSIRSKVVIPSKSGLSFIKIEFDAGHRVPVVIPSKSGLSFILCAARNPRSWFRRNPFEIRSQFHLYRGVGNTGDPQS